MLSFRLALVLSTAFAVAGCYSPKSSAALPIAVTSDGTGHGLYVSPSAIVFSGVGLVTDISVVGGAAPFTSLSVSGCDGIATSNGAISGGGYIHVNAIGDGICTLRFKSSAGGEADVTITVSSLGVQLN